MNDSRATVGSLVRDADSALGHVWEALLAGRLGLEDVRAVSPNLFALLVAAEQMGEAAQEARVRQAESDSDRYYLRAMNGPERAAEIERRLDAAIEQMPEGIEPHGPEYFSYALAGVFKESAA